MAGSATISIRRSEAALARRISGVEPDILSWFSRDQSDHNIPVCSSTAIPSPCL